MLLHVRPFLYLGSSLPEPLTKTNSQDSCERYPKLTRYVRRWPRLRNSEPHLYNSRGVLLLGVMEGPEMGINTPQPSRNLARDEDDKKRDQHTRNKAMRLQQDADAALPQPGNTPEADPVKS